jgi:hypothetical protein
MISYLPLWVVVSIWFLQKTTAPRLTLTDASRMIRLLDDAVRMLPVPRNRWEWWYVTRIIAWIDKEREALVALQTAHIFAVGKVPNFPFTF